MTIWHLSRAILETAWISLPTVAQGLTGRLTAEICDARLDSWSRRLLRQADIRISVRGLEHAPAGESFVIMSNHQSLYDIPTIFQALKPRRIRMVAKTELFRIPIWAAAMRAAGFVEIDRQDRERAITSLRAARAALAAGTNIWIAPEGTRSDSGRLASFKKGGFHLATEAGARILPISISGTRDVLVARGWTVRPGADVVVTIHPALCPADYGAARKEALVDDVRSAVASGLPEEFR